MRVRASGFWAQLLVALGGHWGPNEQEKRLRQKLAQEIRQEAERRATKWAEIMNPEYLQGMRHAAELVEKGVLKDGDSD